MKRQNIMGYPLVLICILLIATISCENEVDKKDPIITWANPADIIYRTQLSPQQLNATADVPGNFDYTPPVGTILEIGTNQILKVDFYPYDEASYNIVSKAVNINVVAESNLTNGKTTAVFNPNVTYGTITDQDGNVYKTVTIGSQTWMAENLRTTKYNDGTDITNVTDNYEWEALITGAYCSYRNTTNTDSIATYGRLYNWYAVNTGKLAPKGWHVPTQAEWTELTTYLGGTSGTSGKLTETGTSHWDSPNTGATNETGFTALPGGNRWPGGLFEFVSYQGRWWSATEKNSTDAYRIYIFSNFGDVDLRPGEKENGISVRCIMD